MAELFYGIANISTVAQLTLRTSVAEGTLEIVPVNQCPLWVEDVTKGPKVCVAGAVNDQNLARLGSVDGAMNCGVFSR